VPDWLALDDALKALEAIDPRKSRMVECRFFGGLDVKETAEALAVSPDTIHRDWRFAKPWLRREPSRGEPAGARRDVLLVPRNKRRRNSIAWPEVAAQEGVCLTAHRSYFANTPEQKAFTPV
jgi:hypothetical protein